MIIGICGTQGAGKDAVALYLEERYGFANFSTSDEIRYVARERGLSTERPVLFEIANEIRMSHGLGEWARRALVRAKKSGKENTAITAIRHPCEIEALREEDRDFIMLAVDAERERRYERLSGRGRPGDNINYDEFVRQEEAELTHPDPAGQQIRACIEASDHRIMNDGTLEELDVLVDRLMSTLHLR